MEGFMCNLDHSDHLTAELWGCLIGLKRAWDLGERDIILRSDSSEALKLITGDDNMLHDDRGVIQEIQTMIAWDWQVECQVISRDTNQMVDKLAKEALNETRGLQILSPGAVKIRTLQAGP
ncbi:uncharacterized protein LOC114715041 [Neltuma alba]|uniref:uncharacterized protein LOC114715041 n=1 Tax=Neltuma alba TaxID=207710 RepID=UPI0010A41D3B|nr:uncharacterized protein LOC114715041 [Prosopis alba]